MLARKYLRMRRSLKLHHMQFSLQSDSNANLVRACSEGEVRVREHVIRSSVILSARRDRVRLAAGERRGP